MFIAEFLFEPANGNNENEDILELIGSLLGAYRMNGQVLGREFPVAVIDGKYSSRLMIAEEDSINAKYNNKYVDKYLKQLESENIKFTSTNVGFEPYSDPVCSCKQSSKYILYTYYTLIESPLRCGDCFNVIPLYKIPPTYDETEYYNVITWESDYQACDTLQMNCYTGERFGINQLCEINSSLSKRGIELCKKIEEVTGIPTYFRLSRIKGKGDKKELERKCPSCNGEWLLDTKLHDIFDFCCDKCKILSNKAWLSR